MRKLIIWLLVCCFLLTAAPLSLAEETDKKTDTKTTTKADAKADEELGLATVRTGNGGSLNMRKKASKKADRVLRIPDGKTVTLLEAEKDGWYHISYDGKKGYVQAEYLVMGGAEDVDASDAAASATDEKADTSKTDQNSKTTATDKNGKTTTSAANAKAAETPKSEIAILLSAQKLRKKPDESSKSVANLEEDAEVTVTAKEGQWAAVTTENDKTGYLPLSALRFSTLKVSAAYPGMNQITEAEARGIAKRVIYDKYGNVFAALTVTATLQEQSSTYETPYYQFDYSNGGKVQYTCYVHAFTREILYANEVK